MSDSVMPRTCDNDKGCTTVRLLTQEVGEQKEDIRCIFSKLDNLQWWIMGVMATALLSLLVLLLK